MSDLIKQSCAVADVYHRYHEIHKAQFGASNLRRMIDTLRGKREHGYAQSSQILSGLREELAGLESQISDPVKNAPVTGADRELRKALLEYARYLDRAIKGLQNICGNREQDDGAYRRLNADGRSRFSADKLDYDHLLSELERMGTRLEKLFSSY